MSLIKLTHTAIHEDDNFQLESDRIVSINYDLQSSGHSIIKMVDDREYAVKETFGEIVNKIIYSKLAEIFANQLIINHINK